mgnify:CR=1 FL=1
MNRDVLSVVGNTIWKEEDRFEIQNQEDFSFREYLWFWCLCFGLGMDILIFKISVILECYGI